MQGWCIESLDCEVVVLIEKGQIQCLGFVLDDVLLVFYFGIWVFVYLLIYEGFGLLLLEVMVCGVFVIVLNCFLLFEVVGNVGLQVDVMDVDGLVQVMFLLIEDDVL